MEARYLTDLEWRICHAVNIYVFRNGRDGEQPALVHIPPSKKKNMKTVMTVIQDRVKYPVGYAKYLFKMDGTRVKDPCELEMYNNYVVASNFEKHFKCAAYGRRRSPLLVLNRDSKHVRVLKLQNQNYYEWLLKKKAVGEERPAYIYPPYYTNENKLPQDLPMGKMGNYNPGEIHAPGCCYPTTEGGRTYRVDSSQNKYVVNNLTVDVTPDFRNMPLPDYTDKRKSKLGQNDFHPFSNKYGGKHGKKLEPTPSDMINANVLISDGTSQEGISVSATSTETLNDQRRTLRKEKESSSKHRQHQHKTKSSRLHMESSEEFHHRSKQQHHERSVMPTTESSTVSTQSSHEVMKKQTKEHEHHSQRQHHQHHQQSNNQKKLSTSKHRQVKVKRKEVESQQNGFPMQYIEVGVPPPPPAQFRDSTADLNNNNKNMTAASIRLLPPTQFKTDNKDILNYIDRAANDPNANVSLAPQKSFYYSPEKLAEINAAGNIQPLELSFATNSAPQQQRVLQQVPITNAVSSSLPAAAAAGIPQWALVQPPPQQQPQQQLLQPMYAIETQPGGPGTPTTTTLIPAQTVEASGVLGTYAMSQNSTPPAQLVQSLALPQASLPSQQALFHNGVNGAAQQCLVLPNNCISPPAPPGTQLIALPGASSQSHLQQVYQLGIVQQPNPQTCIQVDAKAMRQYVDNQKLIECRFQQHQQQLQGTADEDRGNGKYSHRRKPQQRQQQRKSSDVTDITETEVDIPFTPLKTYRLENPPNMTQSHSSIGQNERSQNPSRYRHERLPRVKSRNVAIQMGYPASARSSKTINDYLESIRNLSRHPGGGGGGGVGEVARTSDTSLYLYNSNRSRSDSMANAVNLGPSFTSLMRTPKPERERFFLQNTNSTGGGRALRRSSQFCSSFSDQYLGLHSGRNLALNSTDLPSNATTDNNNNLNNASNPYIGRSARRRPSVDPVLEELITIPPPTEFQSYPLHSTRHQRDHQLDNTVTRSNVQRVLNNNNPSDHSMYPYTNNDRSQYMYSRYQ